jgi:cyclic dehypoxanthinyl futalosine synthase
MIQPILQRAIDGERLSPDDALTLLRSNQLAAIGKAADLVVLSDDPTRVRARDLQKIEVVATIVDGRVEYCAPSVPSDLVPLCPSEP